MSEKQDYFDINAEPNRFEGLFRPDPSESHVPLIDGREDEISTIRDSIQNEPAFTGKSEQSNLGEWLQQKRSQCTVGGNLAVTLLAAMIAGPFAVFGAIFTGGEGTSGFVYISHILYMVLIGPIIEEMLKQSGMIYLLEKKPYRLFSAWQFIFAAVISALLFASIENLLYIHIYTRSESMENPQMFVCFRWWVCTLVHVVCSVIASTGLIRVWKKHLAEGRAADLSNGFLSFCIAMVLHGTYNLTVIFVNPRF